MFVDVGLDSRASNSADFIIYNSVLRTIASTCILGVTCVLLLGAVVLVVLWHIVISFMVLRYA
jgi:hypothetical protein